MNFHRTNFGKAPGLAALACLVALTACNSGGGDSPVTPAPTPVAPLALKQDKAGIRLDAWLENGVVHGHACTSDAELVDVELVVEGATVARTRTERVSDPRNASCFGASAHASFVLPVPAEAALTFNSRGGTLKLTAARGFTSSQVPVPPRTVSSPRFELTKNTATELSGYYCAEDEAPSLRGAFAQESLSAFTTTETARLPNCSNAAGFTFDAENVAEWRHRAGVFSTEAVWLWSGGRRGGAQPVVRANLMAAKVKHGLPVIEAEVNDPVALLDQQWVPTKAPFAFFENMGMTSYEQGQAQGRMAATLRARDMQVWARWNVLQPSGTALTETAEQDVEKFKRGYLDGSGGVMPDNIYVADEPFFPGLEDLGAEKNAQRSRELSQAVRKQIGIFRYAFPGAKLAAALIPGTQFHDRSRDAVLEAAPLFDYIAFDPYIVTATPVNLGWDRPLRQMLQKGLCAPSAYERVDTYITRCSQAELRSRNPNLKFALVMQAFLIRETADILTGPQHTEALKRHWRALSGMAYQDRKMSMGISAFGWRLGAERLALEPGLIPGSTLPAAELLKPDLLEALGH